MDQKQDLALQRVRAVWKVEDASGHTDAVLGLCARSVAGSEAELGEGLQDDTSAARARAQYDSTSCTAALASIISSDAYADNLPAVRRELTAVLLRHPAPPASIAHTTTILFAALCDSWSVTRKNAAASIPSVFGDAAERLLLQKLQNGLSSDDWRVVDGAAMGIRSVLSDVHLAPRSLPVLPWCEVPSSCRMDVELCDEAAVAMLPYLPRVERRSVAEGLLEVLCRCLDDAQESVRGSSAGTLVGLAGGSSYVAQVQFVRSMLLRVAEGSLGAMDVLEGMLAFLPKRLVRAAGSAAYLSLNSKSSIARQAAASLIVKCVAAWPQGVSSIVHRFAADLPKGEWEFQESVLCALEELAMKGLLIEERCAELAASVAKLEGQFEVMRMKGQALPHLARVVVQSGVAGVVEDGEHLFWLVWAARVLGAAPPMAPEKALDGHWGAYATLAYTAFFAAPHRVSLGQLLQQTRSDPHALHILARLLPDLVHRFVPEVTLLVAHTCQLLSNTRDEHVTCALLETLRRAAVLLDAIERRAGEVVFVRAKCVVLTCLTDSQYRAWGDAGLHHVERVVSIPKGVKACSKSVTNVADACCSLIAANWTEPSVCKAALRVLKDGAMASCGAQLLSSVEARMLSDGFEMQNGAPSPVTQSKELSDWDMDSDDDEDDGGGGGGAVVHDHSFIAKWRTELCECLEALNTTTTTSDLSAWCASPI